MKLNARMNVEKVAVMLLFAGLWIVSSAKAQTPDRVDVHGVSEGKTAANGCKNRRYNTLIFS